MIMRIRIESTHVFAYIEEYIKYSLNLKDTHGVTHGPSNLVFRNDNCEFAT